MSDTVKIEVAQFNDQGKVGEFLQSIFAPAMNEENDRAKAAGLPDVSTEDELMAADDFYFSSAEMMDFCIVARKGETIIGICCVNPFTSTLHFIAVCEDQRRKGIGRKLLAAGKTMLKKRGCDHLKIEYPVNATSENAEDFFKATGLNMIGRKCFFGGKL